MTPQEALAESLRDREEAASLLYKLAELGFKIVPMTGLERRMQSGGPGIVETTSEETTPLGSTRWR